MDLSRWSIIQTKTLYHVVSLSYLIATPKVIGQHMAAETALYLGPPLSMHIYDILFEHILLNQSTVQEIR